MTIAQSFLREFDYEMATTRKLLEIVPLEKASWRPYSKSMSLGDLTMHLAHFPALLSHCLQTNEANFGPPDGPRRAAPTHESIPALLKAFDDEFAIARAALEAATDVQMKALWTLHNGEQTIFTLPRTACVRSFILNHMIHHRGQLTVYLRMCGVSLPSVYGPTADTEKS